ncbi:hypothetical protein ABZV29_38245 [Streptomyces sp. NPDC005236]|uniref:hypothetical protein n=1 Tax=Streptomyces sp. NPDC005236 TaxID=3157028 RepID=UPI0033B41808
MTQWTVLVPPRLYEEFAQLSGPGRKAVHEVLALLAEDPRNAATSREPITGAELRQISTEPTADTGDRISILYRVHDPADASETGHVEIIYVISGP